ncbi:MAG: hypothetical protein HC769_21190 [Cyanobacteria bacterium CRU_2_1]|nr:hypothetical protein [Cyanobacteria bacterium RU_5_0]NJR61119.1 hypothetical protein [Cyanobacteria bacterium CRU_2_1]
MPLRPFLAQRTWFRIALQWHGSVVPVVLPRAILCGTFAAFIMLIYQVGNPIALPITASVVLNIVLGLMLVFRTNTAYERFWEGRRLWGGLNNTVRNLARNIWVNIPEKNVGDRDEKKAALYLVVAFAVAMKLYLRQESANEELKLLLSSAQYARLKQMNHPPLEIALWLQDYLQQQNQRGYLTVYQVSVMQQLVNGMVDLLGGCERILKTPIPLAYAIHLKQLLLMYCLMLPFQLVKDFGWWTVPIATLISFGLLGIEEIGIEIENPFGHDANDLKLDAFCEGMKRNIDEMMTSDSVSAHAFLLQEDQHPMLSTNLSRLTE